jgi:hypothetical protein
MPLHGEWKVTGGGPDFPVVPVVACVVAFAVVSALAVILLWLAVVAMVVIAVAVPVAVMMRRRYPDYSPAVAAQGAALRAEQAAALRAEVAAPKVSVVEHHHYMHPLPGVTGGDASWAPLVRGTVEHKEK